MITEAGTDPKVVSLVYVAAFAPDAGQSIGEISQAFAKPAGSDQLQPQPNGFLLLSQKGIDEDFAQDLTPGRESASGRRATEDLGSHLRSQADGGRLACKDCVVRRVQ